MIRGLTLRASALLLVAILGGLVAGERAEAAASSCTLATNGIIFSSYDPVTKSAVTSVGTMSVTCIGNGRDNLVLELSGGSTGSCTTPRQMRRGAASLAYQLFIDAAGTNAWCTGSGAFAIPLDFRTTGTQTVSLSYYGRVFSNQQPTASGVYTDNLTASLKQSGVTLATAGVVASGAVSATCSVSNAALGFASYSFDTAADSLTNLDVNCTVGIGYTISLGAGGNPSGSVRRMAGPNGNLLSYGLFSNSSRTLPWGDGGLMGGRVSGTGTGASQMVPVYGRISAGQNVPAGTYADTVVVTVDY